MCILESFLKRKVTEMNSTQSREKSLIIKNSVKIVVLWVLSNFFMISTKIFVKSTFTYFSLMQHRADSINVKMRKLWFDLKKISWNHISFLLCRISFLWTSWKNITAKKCVSLDRFNWNAFILIRKWYATREQIRQIKVKNYGNQWHRLIIRYRNFCQKKKYMMMQTQFDH